MIYHRSAGRGFGRRPAGGSGSAVVAIAVPQPSDLDTNEVVDDPAVEELHSDDDAELGEVLYLPSPFLDVDLVERPTSLPALAVFGAGLLLAVALSVSAPAIAGLSLVTGIIGGGILNAPAGWERRRTAAALGLPALGLLAITAAFLSSI